MKKKSLRKSASKRVAPRLTYHETGILLENIQHQVELVAEGVQTNTQQINSLGQEMNRRFAEVENGIQTNTQQINSLGQEMNRRFDEVDKRFTGVDRRFDTVDGQIEKLSDRMDKFHDRLDHNDSEIQKLKKAQNS